MRGRHLGFAAASACAALLIFPGLDAVALAAPLPPDTGPYVVQCLNDGMATWSDGTTGYSDWCATGNGSPHGPDGYGPIGPVDPPLPGQPGIPRAPGGPMTPGVPI